MKHLQNQIEALLNNYQLTHLIDPNQVRIDLDTQNTNDYAMIQAIFNDQIEQATQQRDWQRIIDLLKAMVQVSQNVGNYDDTIIAEISLLYLTYSRYYNTDLLQAEINPILMHLQVITQQTKTSYETLDALVQNVTANLTVPNNLPLDLDPTQALHNLIQQTPAENDTTTTTTASQTSAETNDNTGSLDETMQALHQETMQSRQAKHQRVDQEPADVAPTDYDDDADEDVYVPLYKKWWFWTLIVLIVLVIGIIIKLVVTKVTTPSASSDPRTEQVASSKTASDAKKKTNPVPSALQV